MFDSPRLFVRGTLSAAAISVLTISPALAVSLSGISGGYDILVRNHADFSGVHMHGATAVGGDLRLSGNMSEFLNDNVVRPAGVSVGGSVVQGADARINSSGKLQVGKLTSGQSVSSGSLTGNNRNLFFNNSQPVGQVVVPQTIDMNAAFNDLGALSASLAGMTQTLSFNSYVHGSEFKFNLGSGSSVGFDVMNITASQLAWVQTLNFSHTASFDQKLVINVNLSGYVGSFVHNRNGNNEADNILWNFYGASDLYLENQFIGSILAPGLHLQHKGNDIKGSVFVDSFTKIDGQIHVHPFGYDFPQKTPPALDPPASVPDAGSTGLLALLAFPLLLLLKRKG